ncbi:pilus assembly protein TadG-related protein [Limobrevibacterium gyesilva]|uniref:Pilus assembly protein TadG-related protein n=1 Tax=Limobrevibacterium gyesilva TaxID=2991712 RepID=A0AA41YMV1_9PROT|nr:pilus assembly protein TadG-related protein [Limobrevibacterium gyesilva]MCW3476819.1 pilus assembly protein TadG-related protein [Limobrevibacterium gyesilva]
MAMNNLLQRFPASGVLPALLHGAGAVRSRRRLRRRGAVAAAFSVLTVPLVLMIGGAVDYSRSVHFRGELQGVVDSAALAGATVYGGGTSSDPTTTATNYVTAGLSRLPANGGVTPSVSASAVTAGYQVVVSATATMNTTFLGILKPTIPVSVSATALNPFPYGHFEPGFGTAGAFKSSAADTNSLYWYNVPANNSVPPDTALTLLWSSNSGISPKSPPPIPLTPDQKIGFALRNTTGNYGKDSKGNYLTNQYGSTYKHTQTFYSHLSPPTNSTYGYNSTNNPKNVNSVNGASGKNCTLQVVVVNADGTAPSPAQACVGAQTMPAPTCTQLAGKKLVFYWNDMGGPTDDKDYNDAVFTYYCGGSTNGSGGTGSTGLLSVVLTK